VFDIGTQMSLVRLSSGRYVLLDACELDGPARSFIDERTRGGDELASILNLHPFHTILVRAAHAAYPKAKLYGTVRHVERFAELPWEPTRTEDPETARIFADDFDLSIPRGVELVPDDPNLHFSSVLAFHRASRTLHVDDTLTTLRLPFFLRAFDDCVVRFHPTLGKVLERRAGAAEAFRAWGRELLDRARSVDNVCAAHLSILLARDNPRESVAARIATALRKVEGTLSAHEKKHG
jgi:hypothetical protein